MSGAADAPSVRNDPRWPWIAPLLVCPKCQSALDAGNTEPFLTCPGCGSVYGRAPATGVLDLRCPSPKTHALSVRTGAHAFGDLLGQVPVGPPPTTYAGALPPRTTREFMSVIKDDVTPGGFVLEVGGGPARYRAPILGLGFRFLTTDYESAAADILVDAHALPFKTACADALLMQSVSQAFENPFVAFREVARVVKSGGLVLGTADCCAVFAASFYNMTPWGLLSVLQASGLALERLWLTKDALEFCGTNPGYPSVMKPILRGLSRLARLRVLTPRNFLGGRASDPLVTAGSLAFIARKVP